MTEPHRFEDVSAHNQLSLKKLAWAIQTSVGKFKLFLVRCNYTSLRSRLIEQLQEHMGVEIRILELKGAETTLYTRIQAELHPQPPDALMVFGLETVSELDQLLTSTNLVREEFQKNCHFPLVLWINDEILKKLARIAPDFESWAIVTKFAIAPEDLRNFLRQTAEQWFANKLRFTKQTSLELKTELEAARRDLLSYEQVLDRELEANLESLLGAVEYTNNNKDTSLEHYQKGLELWRQTNNLERQAKLLHDITFCHYQKALKYREINDSKDWQATRRYLRQCLEVFEQATCLDLITNSLLNFSRILRQLQEWEQWEPLVRKVLLLHETENKQVALAQDYGFLAEAALAKKCGTDAKELAKKALKILDPFLSSRLSNVASVIDEIPDKPVLAYACSLYRFILAQAQQHLNQHQEVISNLEIAREVGSPEYDTHLYLDILKNLQKLYKQQRKYLEAFEIKLDRQSIEQQYGLRAFVGASRIQPQRHAKLVGQVESQETVAPEIRASGRQLDVEGLIERIGRNDCKLIVLHGQSGVGKSSLVNGGLVPALKIQKAIGTQDVLLVAMRVYTNWLEELGRLLLKALEEKGIGDEQSSLTSPTSQAILEQLQPSDSRNLRPIIIFDQFEEFFFAYPDPVERRRFFEFVGACLNILPVKVVLSLREDYLHYLLECNRLESMQVIGKDILTKDILYRLGNFSRADAEKIINRLTEYSNFRLEPALTKQLVQDLADKLGEVRPIELQVMGAQLQTENITTLAKYQELGTKEELVRRYLDEVVEDCGAENKQAAELLLFLLTDERGTRPLKTRTELERELQALATNLTIETSRLDLVLKIFVRSGLVLLLPENPADRYQLVHDYLAAFIREQQEPRLKELMAELEKERQQRQTAEAQSKLAEEKRERAEKELKQAEEERKRAEKELKQAGKTNKRAKQFMLVSAIAGSIFVVVCGVIAFVQTQNANFKSQAIEREKDGLIISKKFEFGGLEDPFLKAMKTGQDLQEMVDDRTELKDYPAHSPILALQQTLDAIQKQEQSLLKENLADEGEIRSISFNRHGPLLAAISSDSSKVYLWNLQGKKIRLSPKLKQLFSRVSLSSDGNQLATASGRRIQLWQRQGKQFKEKKSFSVPKKEISSISFSHFNQKLLATISHDRTTSAAELWDLQDTRKARLSVHAEQGISCIDFSPNGQKLAAGLADGTIQLRSLDGKKTRQLPAVSKDNSVTRVRFDDQGQMLAAGYNDGTVRLWNLQGQQKNVDLKGHNTQFTNINTKVTDISFSPNGHQLATTSLDGTARLWNRKGIPLAIFEGHEGPILLTSFSPDGQRLATTSSQGTLRLWDLKHKDDNQIMLQTDAAVKSVSFRQDGLLAVSSEDGDVRFWKCQEKGCERQNTIIKTDQGTIYSVSFSPDGKFIATALHDGTIKLWNLKSNQETSLFKHGQKPVRSVSFSPDGKLMATASEDGTIKLWNPLHKNESKLIRDINPQGQQIFSISFSSDGKYLASASADGFARLWNLDCLLKSNSDSICKTKFAGGRSEVFSASFARFDKAIKTPDKQKLVTAHANGTAELWDLDLVSKKNKAPEAIFEGHSDWVRSASFSPDGQMLATASSDRTVRVWTLKGEPLAIFKGHSDRIESVSFSNDGKWLATASRDGTARLWRVKTLPELLEKGCIQLQNQSLNTYFTDNYNYKKDYYQILSFCQDKR